MYTLFLVHCTGTLADRDGVFGRDDPFWLGPGSGRSGISAWAGIIEKKKEKQKGQLVHGL